MRADVEDIRAPDVPTCPVKDKGMLAASAKWIGGDSRERLGVGPGRCLTQTPYSGAHRLPMDKEGAVVP